MIFRHTQLFQRGGQDGGVMIDQVAQLQERPHRVERERTSHVIIVDAQIVHGARDVRDVVDDAHSSPPRVDRSGQQETHRILGATPQGVAVTHINSNLLSTIYRTRVRVSRGQSVGLPR